MGLLKRIYSGKNEPSQALLRNASSPEGELLCIYRESAASKARLNRLMDFFTDCFKLKIHFIIRKTKNIQAVLRKDAAPFTVIQKPLFGGVLCSIQFDDQLCARTVKISIKRFNDALLINFYRVAAQKLIP